MTYNGKMQENYEIFNKLHIAKDVETKIKRDGRGRRGMKYKIGSGRKNEKNGRRM